MKISLMTTALGRFRAMAIICGINLLLLVLYMVAKYGFDAFDEKRDEDDVEMFETLQKDAERAVINLQDDIGVRQRARKFRKDRYKHAV